ncbi:Plasmodium exported protein (Pm-fam-a like), unknown function, partial [Plasmodium malariae]
LFKISLDDSLKFDRKLDIRNYRLLAKYKQNKYSNIVGLNKVIANNGKGEKTALYNNENEFTKKKNQSNRYPLNRAQYYTEVMDYNNGIFDGKYFHFEKKWIRKKDHDAFLEKNRRISDIVLKNIKFRSYALCVFLFILFFLLGIGYPILQGLKVLSPAETSIASLLGKISNNVKTMLEPYISLILFCIPLILLVVIIVITIPKILRNNEKYKKIRYMTE